MIRRPPRSTQSRSSAASDVYKRQASGPWTSSVSLLTGGSVWYQFTITNTGNVTLSSPSVSDPDVSTAGCVWPATLAPAASTSCVVGPIPALSGTHTNTATASATFNSVPYSSASSSASYFGQSPSLSLSKSATPTTYSSVGQTITY